MVKRVYPQQTRQYESLNHTIRTDKSPDGRQEGQDPQNNIGLPLIRHFAEDQKAFWIDGTTRWDRTKVKQLAPFAGFTAALIASDSWMSRQAPANFVHRSHTFSNYAALSLVGAGAGSFLLGEVSHNDHLRETGLLSGEAAINSTAIAYAFKPIAARERPTEGDGNGSFFRGGGSFPSEHAAVAWSIASIAAHEYPGPLTKLLAYSL